MSRFWGGDDTETESEEEESPNEDNMHLNSRFAAANESDDDEDVKRVVRSHKEKHMEALHELVDSIEMCVDGSEDFIQLQEHYKKLNDALVKWKKSSKSENVLAPPPYYAGLLMIQQKLGGITKADKSALDKKQSRAMNTLNQQFKKNLVQYKQEFEEFKEKEENPDEEAAEKELDVADDADDVAQMSSSSSRVDEEEQDDSSVSSSLLKSSEEEEEETSTGGGRKRKRNRKGKGGAAKPAAKPIERGFEEAPKTEWTEERVNQELKDILSGKLGKKKLDKSSQIVKLRELLDKAKNVTQELSIRMHLITSHFDQTISMKQHLNRENWMIVYNEIVRVLVLLDKNRGIELNESVPSVETDDLSASRLVAFLHRLKDEVNKAYRSTDPHAIDYLERLGDEELLLQLARQMARYYNRINHRLEVAQVALLRMSFLHYRRDDLPDIPTLPVRNFKEPIATFNDAELVKPKGNRSQVMEKLLAVVCADGNERMKSHAILYAIYHHALEKRFFEARDLLLLSHLQDQVQHADIGTQILYNRSTAQLGLCAFRLGRMADAHNCLSDLYQSNRVKELLAQGVTPRYGDRNSDQEKIEKQRKVPYHTHMNLELLEVVHLVSAMLLETPNMVSHGYDAKRKIISRSFRRLMDIFDRQVFSGPPESARDHVIAAARALRESNVADAIRFLMNLNCWNLFVDAAEVKAVLEQSVREVGLQTFLLRYSQAFASVSIDFLAAKFGLPPKAVHRIVSRMMINEDIQSCWHQPSGTVAMHQVEPNKLQSLAFQFADKIDTLVSENERSFDSRTGGFGYDKRAARDADDDGHQRKGQNWGGRDNRHNRHGDSKYRDSHRNRNTGGYGRQDFRSWDSRRGY